MFFKNAIFYRFTSEAPKITNEALAENEFKPCGRQEMSRYGWVSPMGDLSKELYHSANGCLMLCARKEEKVLPASVIREKLEQKVKAIEAQEDRRVYRKEKETLKEEIIFDCLPQAFTKSQRTFAYVDYMSQLLIIDASSYTRAEELMKLLRDSLGSLPVVPLQVKESPAVVMTGWLRGDELPETIELGKWGRLAEQREDGAKAGLDKQDLLSEEVQGLLNSGKQVEALEIHFDESMTLRLRDDLSVRRIKFADELISEAQDSADGDKAALFDANVVLMSSAFRRYTQAMNDVFGRAEAPQ